MILNIVDRRKNGHRWRQVNAVIEATWHDNSFGEDQAEVSYEQPDFEEWDGISVAEAVVRASALPSAVTLYFYDLENDRLGTDVDGLTAPLRDVTSDPLYWTYSQWLNETVNKIAVLGSSAPEEDRADYLRVQVKAAIQQALRHGRSGQSDDDPVTP